VSLVAAYKWVLGQKEAFFLKYATLFKNKKYFLNKDIDWNLILYVSKCC